MRSSGHFSEGASRSARAFLQHRLALFGLIAAAIFFFALVCRALLAVAVGWFALFFHPSFYLHLLGALLLLGIWAFSRGRDRGEQFLRAIENAGLILGCGSIAAMGYYIPLEYSPELIVVIALTLGLFARAVFVPSTPRRTLVLGLVIGVPLLFAVYANYAGAAPQLKYVLGGKWSRFGSRGTAGAATLVTGFWWIGTLVVCTAASKVIYGLREKVDEARKLGQYTLDEKLGEGAMGMVFKAHHAMLRRPTAVKLLLPDRVGETHIARFEREVQLTARLTHPHTVTIFDYGRTPDGVFYYAMELLDGAPLDTIVKVDGAQPEERVTYIMDQVAAALAEAHAAGLIHRDIKPANIMLCRQGGEPDVAKVLDFGLVKDVGGGGDGALSRAGEITGTPLYMSPETIIAYHEVDARADLYSLGAVAYFLLTGQHVFTGETIGEICTKHVNTEPVPPSKRLGRKIAPEFESLVLACLEKEPRQRPQSASHLRARLWASRTYGKWTTDHARRWWRRHEDALRRERYVEARGGEVEKTIAIDLRQERAFPPDG